MSDPTLIDVLKAVRRLEQQVRNLEMRQGKRPTSRAEMLSLRQVARECRLSPSRVSQDIQEGLLPATRRQRGARQVFLIRRSDAWSRYLPGNAV
jgi:hypothetical protein